MKRRKVFRTRPEAKEKAAAQNKSWNKRNPIRAKLNSWRRAGINCTVELYEKMLKEQDYTCLICKTPTSSLTRMLDVDHCHKTGKVRGLLCINCNRGLGLFRDSKESLSQAIKYLQKHD